MLFKPSHLLMVVLVILAAGALMGVGVLTAAPPPAYVVGETYIVNWDCLPEWMVRAAATAQGVEQANPCYTEWLTVRAVHRDGWLEVVDATDLRAPLVWRVNPARAIGVTRAVSTRTLAERP